MSTQIKYKDSNGHSINELQLKLTNEYNKEYYEDNLLKRRDLFENDILIGGFYYLAANENLSDKVSEMATYWPWGQFYFNEQHSAGYRSYAWEIYVGTTHTAYGSVVNDQLGREIAEQTLKENSKSIRRTSKTHYLASTGSFADVDDSTIDFGTLKFDYSETLCGVEVWVNLPGFDHKPHAITPDDNILLHPMITPLFSWDANPYYHTEMPLIPQGPIV